MFLSFCDGEKIIKIFEKKYKKHKKGLFLLAPSGAGKTHLVINQKVNDWIDGDDLWVATGAHPKDDWWNQGLEVINSVEQKSDIITKQAKDLGFWIIGSANYWLIPDAIVIPDWKVHKGYILSREKNNYDGGAKSSDFKQVLSHRRYLKKFAKDNRIKVFKTIESAVNFLSNK